MEFGPFIVDEANCDDSAFYVDVQGKGSVQINNNTDGLVINVYPFTVTDDPLGSLLVSNEQLANPPEPGEPLAPVPRLAAQMVAIIKEATRLGIPMSDIAVAAQLQIQAEIHSVPVKERDNGTI